MRISIKGKLIFKTTLMIAILSFAVAGFSSGLDNARIMPTDKVTMFQGDRKVGEFSKEAPLPEGSLLACEGNCGVKMDNLYLVATDGSLFSVTDKPDTRELYVKEGKVYFALSSLPQSLVFRTPDAVFTAQQVMLEASTDGGLLKGYVSVTPETTELGIIEGGSMLVSTVEGEKMVPAGKRILLAQADLGGGAASEGERRLGALLLPGGLGVGIPVLGNILEDDEGSDFTP